MQPIGADTFVVLDLDDTLYKESAYHDSGLEAVARLVRQAFGRSCLDELRQWKAEGVSDLWGALCIELELPSSAKDSFLWAYRLHVPSIRLSDETRATVERLEDSCAGLALLTDGRAVTQRLKVAALGLERLPLYISEEWGVTKPDTKRLVAIQNAHPAARYVYVGDNPAKDFKAPNELGWTTVGLRGDERNVHSQEHALLATPYLPDVWIARLDELLG